MHCPALNVAAVFVAEIEQEIALIVQLPARIRGATRKKTAITTPTANDFIYAAGPY